MKKTLSLILSLLMIFSAFTVLAGAKAEAKTDFTYDLLEDGTVKITKYTGTEKDVVIPETIGGKKVTEIGRRAFVGQKTITSVKIPNGVKKIGYDAFYDAHALKTIEIPESVTEIDEGAFGYCKSLKTIKLPSTLKKIPDYMMAHSPAFEAIEIPESVTEIGRGAFINCEALKSIKLPSKLKKISTYSFFGSGITEIEIPAGVTVIEHSAFGNSELSKITLPNGLKTLESACLFYTKLSEITIPDSVTSIEGSAFEGCKNLKSIKIPEGIKTIESETFKGCSSLENVVLPKSLSKIEYEAFSECTALSKISIPNSVKRIDYCAFNGCTALSKISLGKKINYMGADVFADTPFVADSKNWTGKTLYINNNLVAVKEDIGGNLKIKEGTRTVAHATFMDCKNLTGIYVPASVVSLGNYGGYYDGCTSLSKINVAKDNRFYSSVGGVLFDKAQKTIYLYPAMKQGKVYNIPKAVKLIVYAAFGNCKYLTTVNFDKNSKASLNECAFYNCLKIKTMTIPKGVYIYSDGRPTVGGYWPKGLKYYDGKVVKGFTIRGYRGSSAEYTCEVWPYKFVSLCKDGTEKHTYKNVKAKKPTYFKNGYTAHKYCTVCGDRSGFQKIDKLELDYTYISVAGGKGKMKVKYNAVEGATGFQLRYVDSKGNMVKKNYKTTKSMTVTIKNLAAGEYKVYAKAFVISGKQVATSRFWNIKTVTVK